MKRFLFLFICWAQINTGWAQFEKSYVPLPILDTVPADVHTQLKLRLDKDKSQAKGSSLKETNYMKSLYEKRFEYVVGDFNKDYFITDRELTPYLQRVHDKIYKANPQLPRETQVYAYRSNSPNAISFGNGVIAITLGLLARLTDEAQIAFVLCHELAHYHLQHSDLKIKEIAHLNFDKDLEREVRTIKSNEYNKYTKLKKLFEDLGLSVNRHSQKTEFEADSIGLVYFGRTGYDLSAAIRTMEALDSADISKYPENIDLASIFNFREYPFKSGWNEYTKSTTWHVSQQEKDSVRTHPDCKKRIAALERQLTHVSRSQRPIFYEKIAAKHINTMCEFEMVSSFYHYKQYGKAMFHALLLSNKYPDNAYLHAIIGRSLYNLYVSQKNHELGKVLELPDPRFDENYDRFLTFLHRLRLGELAALSYHYMISQKQEFFSNEEYLYSLWLCSNLDVSNVDPDKVKEDYVLKYPSGKFIGLMK